MSVTFRIKASEAQGRRLDPEYHHALRRTRIRSTYPSAKLLSLSYFRTGGTPFTAHPEYWNGSIPWVSAKDFKAFRFEDSEDHVTELALAESTTCYVNRPAVLMVSRSGILQHTLPVMVTHKPMTINQDIKAFFPDDRVSVDYLGAFFDVFGSRLLPLVCKSGATVQSLNTEQLMDLSIPLPPLPEQRKIVAELDVAYAAKRAADEKATKLLASIDDMVLNELGIAKLPKPDTSLSSRIFIVPAREVANTTLAPDHYFDSIDFSKAKYPCERFVERIDIDPPCGLEQITKLVPMEGVSAEWCAIERIQDISPDATQGYSTFRGGDVIWARITPCMENGKSAVVEAEPSECFCGSTEFLVFRPKDDKVNPYYLQSLLHLKRFREVAAHHFTGTSGHQRVTSDFFKSISIPVPPRSVQDRIASTALSIRAEARKLKADATAALDAAKRKIECMVMKDNR